ncbi:MAG: preprotein translocase subunit SecG [Ruminococcus sp.]|nr:preprotein translocase subunit SecG [Ruminococcus sp.]
MSGIEIVAGILLILASLVIVLIVLVQESKEQGLTSAIGGGANDSFYGKNSSRTRDAKLSRFTKVAAVIFFIVTLVVNIIVAVQK